MQSKPRRAQVTVHFEDGGDYHIQGAVFIKERITTAGVDYRDGKHKEFPLHTAEVVVIIKDEAYDEVGER